MRTVAALLLIGIVALTAPALAQTNTPANPTAVGPVPPPLDALWPPANAGCGENGTTNSDIQPTVRLTSATLRLTPRGGVHIRLRGDQTAAMFVKLAQVGGKRVGGTERGTYNCTAPGTFTNSKRLSDYGRKIVGRHGRLAVKLTLRIINGSGVTNKRVLSGVIKPALLTTGSSAACTPKVGAPAQGEQGELLPIRYVACQRGSHRFQLIYVNGSPSCAEAGWKRRASHREGQGGGLGHVQVGARRNKPWPLSRDDEASKREDDQEQAHRADCV